MPLGGAVVTAIASYEEGCSFASRGYQFLGVLHVVCGFAPNTTVSSHSLKIKTRTKHELRSIGASKLTIDVFVRVKVFGVQM